MDLILNFSLSSIMIDAGRFTLFPFKVTLASFQYTSIISHNIFVFNLTYLGFNFLVILNKCMLYAVLHNFTGV